MPVCEFYKFSPSGNTTLFLLGKPPQSPPGRASLCRQALASLDAEQAGFADVPDRSLTMAAGEFCVNACRAFGALLAGATGKLVHQIHVSGFPHPVRLAVSGSCPHWHVAASFPLPPVPLEGDLAQCLLARLPGIAHLLLPGREFPDAERTAALAAILRQEHGLEDMPASGIVWWREHCGELEIHPFVHVAEAGTSMLESSCGSATLALALAMASRGGAFSIRQPCGETLATRLADNLITIAGSVRLIASGSLWLDPLPAGMPK